jgi:hypothetical protein
LSKCIECIGELYFEFREREKIESLRILENSARWELSWCRCAQKELFVEFREKGSVTGKTLTGLMSIL